MPGNVTFCATLVDEWVRWGLTDAVVCPGSRSTPLAVALREDGRVRVHVHHDERSGAFMALGLARATHRPVAVVATSGTATVEFHPAVVEADLDRVALLVLTADRPPRLRGVGAPQTIDQLELYGTAVRAFVDAPVPDPADAGSWRRLARSVWRSATGPSPGPVQLNLPFDEPLLDDRLPLPVADADDHVVVVPDDAFTLPDPVPACGVIVAGGAIDDPAAVLALADHLGWPVIADPRSGCRVPEPCVIAHADALLRADGPHLRTEMIVRFGPLPASKVVNQWLAGLDVPHVHIDPRRALDDPHGVVTRRVHMEASAWAASVVAVLEPRVDDAWRSQWRAADDAAEAAIAADEHGDGPTEPGIARAVVAAVPDGGSLVVSSSMPVRDVEWYGAARRGLVVHANRGANGIDGVISTAVGVALAGRPTALLIGDVAFLHDTNGLLGVDRRDVDLCIVVIDNDGGGIFSFLPQASMLDPEVFEDLFGTPHGVDLGALAHAHGLPVLDAADDAAVGVAVAAALTTGGVHVVRVRTSRSANVDDHERLNAAALAAARAVGWDLA
jgi:2-succinyl-5-enolpyruvyl-6-hydroxy-3-cyclohexene-1-carboxylate synthase